MKKYFELACVKFSLSGNEQYVKRFSNEFKMIEVASEKIRSDLDCSFSFVNKLPPKPGSYISFLQSEVGTSWVDIKEFPFIYRIQKEREKTVVIIAPNREMSLKEKIVLIPTTHQFIHPSFKTKEEAFISIFIFKIWHWIIFLKLIEKGLAFIHASSVLINNKAYVFGSWGGVGKTTILLKLITENSHIQFLSDDMSLIDIKGNVFLNPTPLHIYPYNWRGFPSLKEKVFSNRSLIDRSSWWFWSKLRGQNGVCRRMFVEHLVGNGMGRRGQVDKFFFLKRTNKQKLSFSPITNKKLTAKSFSLIQQSVMDNLCKTIYPIAASETTILKDVFDTNKRLFDIYKNFLEKADVFEVLIPTNITPNKLSAFINNKICNE